VMFFDLMIAGLIQGFSWRDLAPWEASLMFSVPFWFTRTLAGTAMIVGQFMFVANIIMTAKYKRGEAAGYARSGGAPAPAVTA